MSALRQARARRASAYRFALRQIGTVLRRLHVCRLPVHRSIFQAEQVPLPPYCQARRQGWFLHFPKQQNFRPFRAHFVRRLFGTHKGKAIGRQAPHRKCVYTSSFFRVSKTAAAPQVSKTAPYANGVPPVFGMETAVGSSECVEAVVSGTGMSGMSEMSSVGLSS